MNDDESEDWLLDAGDAVIQKKADQGYASLTALDRLIYCLWVADYGMRNAGDLATADDLFPGFQDEARHISQALGLSRVASTFSLPRSDLERNFFREFSRLCTDIRGIELKS